MGLGVRDAGGTPLKERRHDAKPYPNLRIDLPLEPGMVVTVEPGVYFVPAILADAENRHRHRNAVDWARVDTMLDFGGIRIEDNILITEAGPDVITADVPVLGAIATGLTVGSYDEAMPRTNAASRLKRSPKATGALEAHTHLDSTDRRTLLKMAAGATLAAPVLTLLRGLTGDGAVARAAGAGNGASTPAASAVNGTLTPDASGVSVTLGGVAVRPPSIPLAVHSPYLSTWLPATSLTAATPQFWNGANRTFVGLVRIDGQLYAWAGAPVFSSGSAVTPLTAISTDVTATRSIFTAGAGGVELVAEWLSPVEPGNLALQSAPLTLLTISSTSPTVTLTMFGLRGHHRRVGVLE